MKVQRRNLTNIIATLLGLFIAVQFSQLVLADSIKLTEKWKDNSYSDAFGYISTDTGTNIASLTIPGLSAITANDWSNLFVTVSISPYQGSAFSGDVLSDAPTYGGTLNATNAIFYFQGVDTNGNFVNIEKLTFTRTKTGDILTVTDQTLNTAATQPPWSILAAYYLNTTGPIQDQETYEVTLQNDDLDNGNALDADILKTLFITGTNTVTSDSKGNLLSNIAITGVADFVAPTLTAVSPTGATTTTNGVSTVQVKATDNTQVANVEFFWNGQDFGSGSYAGNPGPTTVWSLMSALAPGANLLQTVATDVGGNNSATNGVTVTFSNPAVANGNTILFSERYVDYAESDGQGDTNLMFGQDAGVLTAALPWTGLQSLAASTWSNLNVSLSFGDINFSTNLSKANVLTATNATFYVTDLDPNGNVIQVEQLTFTRVVNTLQVFKRTCNPSYNQGDNTPIVVDSYYGKGGAINDIQQFNLSVADGGTAASYLNVSRTVYVTGNNVTNFDTSGNLLNNIQVTGAADTTGPTVQITSPTVNQQWSNSVFTVTGKAGDNVAVANVYYSIDGSEWILAQTSNNWANWSTTVNLTPGTNTISAYAVDTMGNASTTITVSFVYVVSAPLLVNVTGGGVVTPNYNGVLLPLGKTYSMKAINTNGSAFTGWTGSITTNSPTLIFTMMSNLVFTANFADTNRPTVSVTNLVSGQKITSQQFLVQGKAADNAHVANVSYQLNKTGWLNATTSNNFTNWAALLSLTPGTNVFQVYATDTSGNVSTTNTLNAFYVVSAVLQIQTTGLGKILPNYSNAVLTVGQNYSITSAPAAGFVFTNWVISTNWIGGVTYGRTNLTFTMSSNLTLLANFVDVTRPTVTITSPTANQRMTNALATLSGTASDNWKVAGVWYSFNGGAWTLAPTANNWANWSQTLMLVTGTNTVKVYAKDLGGNFSLTNTVNFISGSTYKLQLVFNPPTPVISNGVTFSLLVSSNLNGHIQYSTNLQSWVNLTTFKGTNSTLNFRDTGATTTGQRFYRAAIP